MVTSKPGRGRVFQVAQYLSMIYVIFITSWLISWLTIGDKIWWMTVLNTIVPCLFLPTLLLLVPVFWFRSSKAVIQLLIPVLIFGALYFPYFCPRPSKTGEHPGISVMTYNALFRNTSYNYIAQMILIYQPDFVAFQEIQPVMMEQLKQRLGGVYPYSVMAQEHSGGTTAIFSRHPGTRAYALELGLGGTASVWEAQIDQRNIKVISAHFISYDPEGVEISDIPKAIMKFIAAQNKQAQLIVDEIQNYDGEVILGCDCNSKETSSSYKILAKTFNNSARVAGWSLFGKTPENTKYDRDIQHIDYVFYRGELVPFQVVTIQNSAGSDHLPVLASFEGKR